MIKFTDGMTFYHGSYCEVSEPDLKYCARKKDFGRGFYVTTSEEQAESFVKTSIIKAVSSGKIDLGQKYGFVSIFTLDFHQELSVKVFQGADVEWLHCVAAHRKNDIFQSLVMAMERFDVIAGKIANDATNATLTAYISGVFGKAGEKATDDFCIRQLLPNKLKDQYCFKTEKALSCLRYIGSEKVWLKK